MRSRFLPEGRLLHTPENEAACASCDGLRRAMEGVAQLCDGAHNLLVSVGPFTGFLPREEAALGIAEGTTREIAILSRVGKPVCFQITALEESGGVLRPRLSRRRAQQAALDAMLAGLHPGCIPDPDQRFRVGQAIFAVVQELDPKLGRVYLTHRELLGTWAENAARFQAGMTVPGIVRGLKEYGAFVELTPNLSGLAERKNGLREGDRVSVYIKAILPERMKIKLLAIDTLPPLNVPAPLEYFLTQGQIEKWKYAPEGCVKVGAETIFA